MKLHARGNAYGVETTVIGRVARQPVAAEERGETVLFDASIDDTAGYLAVVSQHAIERRSATPVVSNVIGLDYVANGDVVALDPTGFVRTLYRKSSRHNFILATEQCNSYCLMCSQPPKQANDFGRFDDHLRLVDLIDPATEEIGITGGEPTLYGDRFIELIARCERSLPRTAVHVLTNGRAFFYRRFAEQLGHARHHDLVLGIPLYSDIDSEHDYIVQSRGAFEETIVGLLNLDRYDVAVEVRIVLHRLSIPRLAQLARFIARNLPFVCHVAVMGLEMFGFVHHNMDELWIDPADYSGELYAAVEVLASAGLNVSIYNHQLCTIDRRLWRFARRSISDWKNVYLDACDGCSVRESCGGFFQSATKRHSSAIRPIREVSVCI